MREFTPLDQIIKQLDKVIFALSPQYSKGSSSCISNSTTKLTDIERNQSIALMRINHTGEVCAQSLYLGQALVAHDTCLVNQLYAAAEEEKEHLQWCATRLQELNGRTSFLDPLFAAGAFGIGIVAGLAGDRWSLGFLAETEQQVSEHLNNHLNKISPRDVETRAILTKMREDELRHKTQALEKGGRILPRFISGLMKLTSKIMTFTTQYF